LPSGSSAKKSAEETEWPSSSIPMSSFFRSERRPRGVYRGIDDMERFFADTLEVFEKFEPHYEFLDVGDRGLRWGEIHVRARGSGIETDIPTGGILEFRDGKIVRWEDFGSKEKGPRSPGAAGVDEALRRRACPGRDQMPVSGVRPRSESTRHECFRTRLFRKPPVRPPRLRDFWAWLRTSSSVIVSSCC
jgi:hypothetical protein